MSTKIYSDEEASLAVLEDKTIAVIGYGNQGCAQANNMRDSGLAVILGLRQGGGSWREARKDGFDVYPISEAARRGDIVHLLIPDPAQPRVYRDEIAKHMDRGKALGFSHGFNIHFRQIVPPPHVDVVMVAPKSPGALLREMFVKGSGVPGLFAVYQDGSGRAREVALAMAKAIGCTRIGVLETTFREETESDLIGEQTVLVGGLMELIRNGFEVLVEAGYQPELAYFEACNEAKLIMDLIYKSGLTGMLKAVSDTAKYGGLTVGPKVIDDRVKENMRRVVEEVRSGRFAKKWIEEDRVGRPDLKRLMSIVEEHQLERVGRLIRRMAGIEK